MPIVFDDTKVHDYSGPQTVENAIRAYANWSGIHAFDFKDLYAAATSVVTCTGGGWDVALIDDAVPSNVLIEYHATELGHGAVLKYMDASNYWIVGITTAGNAIVQATVEGSTATLYSSPVDMPAEADVQIGFRQMVYSDNKDDVWHAVSLWANDALIFTFTYHIGEPLEGTIKCGLAAYGGNRTLTNVRIPLLTNFVEWASLDPGETPMGGLQRAIEGRYIKLFIRWDGSMRAWRTVPISLSHTFADENIEAKTVALDKRVLFTHVRMMGAYRIAEYHRTDLTRKFGHKFKEVTNPFLMSTSECYEQAEKEIRRMEQQAYTEALKTPFRPLLEPEDRVATPDGDRFISSLSWEFTPAEINQSLSAREYTES